MSKIGIFAADSNGGYPIPATKGGAVSILIEHLVEQNSVDNLADIEIISFYEKKAFEISKKYNNVTFVWIKVPFILKFFDWMLFNVIRKLFKKKKHISYKSICALLYYILKSSKIIKKNNYDKVVLENNIPLAWIIKLSKYSGDYYYHFHNVPRVSMKCKDVFGNCKAILCVSEYVSNQICSQDNPIGPIDCQKIKVLYNCVDTKKFNIITDENAKDKIRKKYCLSKEDKILLFVGRLSAEKGVDKILEALNVMNNKQIKLLIVGSLIHDSKVKDDYQDKLHALAEKLKENVIFTGYIDQDDLSIMYNIADIAILPSMWDEPAGLTMVEALSCGVSVITTKSGGIPEYVDDCAIILNRDNHLVESIALNIDKIIRKKDNKKHNSYLGRKRVEQNFSMESYLKNFIRCLND